MRCGADLESYACVMMLMAGLAISTVGEEERTRKAALATGSEEVGSIVGAETRVAHPHLGSPQHGMGRRVDAIRHEPLCLAGAGARGVRACLRTRTQAGQAAHGPLGGALEQRQAVKPLDLTG